MFRSNFVCSFNGNRIEEVNQDDRNSEILKRFKFQTLAFQTEQEFKQKNQTESKHSHTQKSPNDKRRIPLLVFLV